MCTVPDHADAQSATDAQPDFETAMRELEELVERLEQGDLSLEESLAAFERGVTLTRTCQSALKEAEQKVEICSKKPVNRQLKNSLPTTPSGLSTGREHG